MKIHAAILSAALLGLFGWVWRTNAQVQSNQIELDHRSPAIKAVPQIKIDIAVIKADQKRQAEDTADIKEDVKDVLTELRRQGGHR